MFSGANYYGIKKILLQYAGLPTWFPLPVAVQHGWQPKSTGYESSSNPPEIWVWSKRIQEDYRKKGNGSCVRSIGSPLNYLLKNLGIDLKNCINPRRGSICIPPHSTHHAQVVLSHDELIRRIKDLHDDYGPYLSMLYYLDMNDEIVEKYKRFGIDTVSNGSLFSDDFIDSFVANVIDKKHCFFSEMGTAIFFASLIGLKPIYMNMDSSCIDNGDPYFYTKDDLLAEGYIFLPDSLNDMDFVESEMGVDCVITKAEMRGLILRNYMTRRFVIKFIKTAIRTALRPLNYVISGPK
jgi:hypothetical protein